MRASHACCNLPVVNKVRLSALTVLSLTFTFSISLQAATLVGYWDFEETSGDDILDMSGFDNNGDLTGATRAAGKVGQGLSFDGTGGLTIPNSPTLDAFPSGFSMSAWIKPSSYPDFLTIFFKTDRNNLIHQLHFQVDGRLYCAMNRPTSEGGFEGIGPNTVALNQWQFVAWTFDGQRHRFYDDGVEVFSAPYTQHWVGNNEVLQIGQHRQATQANFRGMMDEARIYSGAQTQDEMMKDMNAGPFSLVENGSFEEGKKPWKGWKKGKILSTTEVAYHETLSAKFVIQDKLLVLTHGPIPVTEGQCYRVLAAIKTAGAVGDAFVQLTWRNEKRKIVQIDTFGNTTGTTDWTLESSDAILTPPDAVDLVIQLATEPGEGTDYFDNIRLQRLGAP